MKNTNIYLIVIMIVIIITNIFTNVVEGYKSISDAVTNIIGNRKNATSVPKKDDIRKDMGTLPVTASPRVNNINWRFLSIK